MAGQASRLRANLHLVPISVVVTALVALAVAAAPAAARPRASIQVSNAAPLSGEPVTFASTAEQDGEVPIVSHAWDLDDDGEFDDAAGTSVTAAFSRPGRQRVALRVADAVQGSDTVRLTIEIGNRGPTAAISYAPAAPLAQERVTFTSTSSDPEGSVTEAWDLDGDGRYDDARGPMASEVFPAGSHTVGLRVTDASGATNATTVVVRVAVPDPPAAAPVVPSDSAAAFLQPFPVIRIVGRASRRGTRVTLLTITAPAGSVYAVRCSGRGCPSARSGRGQIGPRAPDRRTVRIRSFAGRVLRPGAKMIVRVSHPQLIGKYSSFTVRRRRAPLRRDRCLLPAVAKIVRC